MSLINHIPGLKGTGSRRAIDKVEELRDENRRLLAITHRAGDDIALLQRDLTEERQRRGIADKALKQAEAAIRLRDQENAQLRQRITVGVKAEHVIAKTQEIPVEEIRRHCVMPLNQAPFATTNPGRVAPSWAVQDEPSPAA